MSSGVGAKSAEQLAAALLPALVGAARDRHQVGCDVVDLRILARQLAAPAGARFVGNVMTAAEEELCGRRVERLGGQWAAKEAVAKAIGCGWDGLSPRQVEILRDDAGAPFVRRSDHLPWPSGAHEWDWSVSIAHDGDMAMAVAVATASNRATTTTSQARDGRR